MCSSVALENILQIKCTAVVVLSLSYNFLMSLKCYALSIFLQSEIGNLKLAQVMHLINTILNTVDSRYKTPQCITSHKYDAN